MAQALELRVWCDVHQDTPARTVDATLNGQTRVLDLCDDCIAQLVAPLAATMQRYGRQPAAVVVRKPSSKSERGQYPCTMPDCGSSYRHKQTLRSHVQQRHGRTLAELYREHGDGGARSDTPPSAGEYVCPECAHIFTTPQGLGGHRQRMHGVTRAETRAGLALGRRTERAGWPPEPAAALR